MFDLTKYTRTQEISNPPSFGQEARFTVPKSKAKTFTHPSIKTTIQENGETWYDLKGALLAMNSRPVQILDLFRNDPSMIQHLLELETKWDEIKQSTLPPPTCSVCLVTSTPRLRCSACMKQRIEVMYCGRKCQEDGWKEHRKVCKSKTGGGK